MKTLISAQDIEKAREKGEREIFYGENTIVTHMAEDLAREYGIKISRSNSNIIVDKKDLNIDKDLEEVYKLVRAMKERGYLESLMAMLNLTPYDLKKSRDGLGIVKANSIEYEEKYIGGQKILHQKLVENQDKNLESGSLILEELNLERKFKEEFFAYLEEGSLRLTSLDSKESFEASSGDLIYIPREINLLIEAKKIYGRTKLLYIKN